MYSLLNSPSMLESEGGVHPSILTLGGTIDDIEEVRDSMGSGGGLGAMYSGGIALKVRTYNQNIATPVQGAPCPV